MFLIAVTFPNRYSYRCNISDYCDLSELTLCPIDAIFPETCSLLVVFVAAALSANRGRQSKRLDALLVSRRTVSVLLLLLVLVYCQHFGREKKSRLLFPTMN